MSRILLSLGVLGLASAMALGAGCAHDRPSSSEALDFGATLVPIGTGDGGATTSTAPSADCTAVAVDAGGVSETFVNAETPPDPLGGDLPSGTFVLTDITRFESWSNERDDQDQYVHPPPTSNRFEAKLLVVDGKTFRFAGRNGTLAAGLESATEISGGTIAASGASVVLTQSCPTRSSLTLGYTAIGGSIAIYTDPKRRETFQPLPQ